MRLRLDAATPHAPPFSLNHHYVPHGKAKEGGADNHSSKNGQHISSVYGHSGRTRSTLHNFMTLAKSIWVGFWGRKEGNPSTDPNLLMSTDVTTDRLAVVMTVATRGRERVYGHG